jgi:hypothetical protein
MIYMDYLLNIEKDYIFEVNTMGKKKASKPEDDVMEELS